MEGDFGMVGEARRARSMSDSDVEALIKELTELRWDAGLTVQSIAKATAVIEALGNPTPEGAARRLTELVRQLGESEEALVLRRAYAIDISPPGVLSARRLEYQKQTHRDKKTIIRYENRMIRELASLLIKGANQRETLHVGAWIHDRVLTYARVEFDEDVPVIPMDVQRDYRYPSKNESIPIFVYQLPDGYAPQRLVLGIIFKSGDHPSEIWGINTPDVLELSTARYERQILSGGKRGWRYMDFERPAIGHYYGFGWRY
jgi:hypothetical protein